MSSKTKHTRALGVKLVVRQAHHERLSEQYYV